MFPESFKSLAQKEHGLCSELPYPSPHPIYLNNTHVNHDKNYHDIIIFYY